MCAAASVWGNNLHLSIFGESHGPAIGLVLDGLPAGEPIDEAALLLQMGRRAPGRDKSSTPRKEADIPKILSGLLNGITTGAPLCILIENTNTRSKDYGSLGRIPRPGHSDYAAYLKYGGYNDIRGGGHFSGRLTACLCAAGAVCRQILSRRGIRIAGHVASIGPIRDSLFPETDIPVELMERLSSVYFPVIDAGAETAMRDVIEEARMSLDSVGGVVECAVTSMPGGLGGPLFGGVESLLSSILFGIPAVKGVEFGAGFGAAQKRGSENNDPYQYGEDGGVKIVQNSAGGILGGITTGAPILFRLALKPTPSIAREQKSVDLLTKENVPLSVHGRHDPCVVPRAVPVAESAAAVAMLELLLSAPPECLRPEHKPTEPNEASETAAKEEELA